MGFWMLHESDRRNAQTRDRAHLQSSTQINNVHVREVQVLVKNIKQPGYEPEWVPDKMK